MKVPVRMTCACCCLSFSFAYCFFKSEMSKVIRCGSMLFADRKFVVALPTDVAVDPIQFPNEMDEEGDGVRLPLF